MMHTVEYGILCLNYNNELINKFPTVASDSSDEEIEETEEIKNAYIPYLYAKKNIIKVIKDMKRMRFNHIHIVADIQKEYKSIEDETQVWLISLIFMNDITHAEIPSPVVNANNYQSFCEP